MTKKKSEFKVFSVQDFIAAMHRYAEFEEVNFKIIEEDGEDRNTWSGRSILLVGNKSGSVKSMKLRIQDKMKTDLRTKLFRYARRPESPFTAVAYINLEHYASYELTADDCEVIANLMLEIDKPFEEQEAVDRANDHFEAVNNLLSS